MPQITQAELHSLHELLAMEGAMYEKFRLYRQHAGESHIRELCDHLLARSRQHATALAQLLGADLPESDGEEPLASD